MSTPIFAGFFSAFLLHKAPLRGDVGLAIGVAIFSALCANAYRTSDRALLACVRDTVFLTAIYLSSVCISTVTYRLSIFHPLARFPGPTINKITSLQLVYIIFTGKRHLYIDALHQKYGKVVRTGPNTLSINSHAAVSPLYASSMSFDKTQAYVLGRARGSGLFFMPSKSQHNSRRRLWASAFTPQALESYKAKMETRLLQLKECITARCDTNGVIDIGQCLQHWSFDFMCDLVFGGSNQIELMKDGDPLGFVGSGQMAMVTFEALGEAPSLFDILWYLPVSSKIKALESLAERLLIVRERDPVANADDIASHLLGAHTPSSEKLNFEDRRVDSLFAIQAGSDTTAGVMIYHLFLLISNKAVYTRLRAELDAHFDEPDVPISTATLASLSFLDATVHESLRFGAPLPGLPRVVPPAGLVLEDNVFIPGGTIVSVPPYPQQLSEENYYPEPRAYRPERWLPVGLGTDTRTRKEAIMSFSYGAFGCLGRGLAIMELRLVTARLLLAYDLSFAPGFDETMFVEGVQNMRTTIFTYPLKVVAVPRKRSL